MEGPGCLRAAGSAVRLAPLGAPALWGRPRPGRNLGEADSSAAPGPGKATHELGPSWPPPSAPTPFRGLPVPLASAATRGERLRAWSVHGHRPRRPRRLRHSTPGHRCAPTRVTSGRSVHPWSAESRRRVGRPGVPRSLRLAHRARTQARTPGLLRARASRPRAPGIYIFPSLGERGSRLHPNEERGARGDLHVSGRPETEPLGARSGRHRAPLFIYLFS